MKSLNNITIYAVGDIQIADGYFDIGYGMGSQIEREGVFYPFSEVAHVWRNADITFGNLECVISDESPQKGLRRREFLASSFYVKGLKDAGFDVLSVSNNHILQHGEEAFRNTISSLEKNGIKPIGHIPANMKEQEVVNIICNDIKIGFLSYSLAKDEHNPTVSAYALYYRHEEKIIEEVDKVRDTCDVLVVSLHWGEEYMPFPAGKQIDLAHKLVNSGVDVIIGHHPHVLQGIELYKGKTIAYSLGNFVFNKMFNRCRHTAILKLNIQSDGTQNPELIPIWINETGQPQIPGPAMEKNIKKVLEENDSFLKQLPFNFDEYNIFRNRILKEYRKNVKKTFIKNIHNIKITHLFQMIYEYLARRVSKL